ncbi:MAG: TIGR01777 family oxidoreductase [Bacteroidetes bacterium]|nr:TIGR01777 family oxidoreductase [Bacteroidota bacterium]
MTTLLAGGTGFIGARLTEMLRQQGHTVRLLSRQPKGPDQFAWDLNAGTMDERALQGVDYLINLTGAGIADKRWTTARKKELIESRTKSAQVLAEAIRKSGRRPKALVSAAAIGYYGNSGEKEMLESDLPVGNGFMVDCCERWEQAADEIAQLSIRTVKLRIGIVLGKEGGALREMLKPFLFGIGAYFGNGQAWYSWIHRDDICRMMIWALEQDEVEGVFNAVAPNPVRNKTLVQAIARARKKPAILMPVPAFALKIALGEMSATILNSNRVSSEKVEQAGFTFLYPGVNEALEAIFT